MSCQDCVVCDCGEDSESRKKRCDENLLEMPRAPRVQCPLTWRPAHTTSVNRSRILVGKLDSKPTFRGLVVLVFFRIETLAACASWVWPTSLRTEGWCSSSSSATSASVSIYTSLPLSFFMAGGEEGEGMGLFLKHLKKLKSIQSGAVRARGVGFDGKVATASRASTLAQLRGPQRGEERSNGGKGGRGGDGVFFCAYSCVSETLGKLRSPNIGFHSPLSFKSFSTSCTIDAWDSMPPCFCKRVFRKQQRRNRAIVQLLFCGVYLFSL